jgi:hypothetical protein
VAKETKFLEELLGIPGTPKEYVPPRILYDSVELNEQSAGAVFRQNIGVILAHSGFDGLSLCLTIKLPMNQPLQLFLISERITC